MELTSHRIRKAFAVLVVFVGLLLVVNLPSADEIRTGPSSNLVRFSVDHRVTAVHRNLKEGHHAEVLGDSAARFGEIHSDGHLRTALERFRRAEALSEQYKSGGYLMKLVRDSVVRVESKLRSDQ